VHGERNGYREGADHAGKYGCRGTILHRPDLRMNLGTEMVGQPLDGGVDELRCEHAGARERYSRPPDGLGPKYGESRQDRSQRYHLETHAALRAQGLAQARQSEADAVPERLVLLWSQRE